MKSIGKHFIITKFQYKLLLKSHTKKFRKKFKRPLNYGSYLFTN